MILRSDRVLFGLLTAIISPLAVACGSSADAPPDQSGESGGAMIGDTGGSAAAGDMTASAGGGAGSAISMGVAGHAGTSGALGSAGGSGGSAATADASTGAKPDATPMSDATISVQPDGPWKVAPLPAVGTAGVVYLSDLVPTKVALFDKIGGASKSGPMHNDESFTGKPLVINGVYYAKGIGVHTYAQITYSLGGMYTKFVSDTGLDFLENSATMIFEVNVDDKLVYDNGNGTKTKDQVAPVSLDVTGKSTLMLYVRDGFDDASDDFGVWGGARLLK